MERLLIPIDFDKMLDGIDDDAAKWRIVSAMLCYSRGEDLPSLGSEKMVWNLVKKICDDWIAYCEKQSRNGRQPKTKKPDEAKPSQKKPDEAKKSQSEPTLHNITLHNITQHINTPLEDAMDAFRAHRKSLRKPLNELSEKRIMTELDNLSGGNDDIKIQILDQSIRNGWAGVFELKSKRNYLEHPASDLDHLLTNLDGD